MQRNTKSVLASYWLEATSHGSVTWQGSLPHHTPAPPLPPCHLSPSSLSRLSLPPPPLPMPHDSGVFRRASPTRSTDASPLPPLFPSLRPDAPLVAPRAQPRPLPMARVPRVASPPTPARRRRLCSALSEAHRKSHGRLRLVDGTPAPGGCGADAHIG